MMSATLLILCCQWEIMSQEVQASHSYTAVWGMLGEITGIEDISSAVHDDVKLSTNRLFKYWTCLLLL